MNLSTDTAFVYIRHWKKIGKLNENSTAALQTLYLNAGTVIKLNGKVELL